MPRLTTPTTTLIRRASHLPATSPMRQAARAELAADGANLGDLSKRFGVHRAQVRRIIFGERWKE